MTGTWLMIFHAISIIFVFIICRNHILFFSFLVISYLLLVAIIILRNYILTIAIIINISITTVNTSTTVTMITTWPLLEPKSRVPTTFASGNRVEPVGQVSWFYINNSLFCSIMRRYDINSAYFLNSFFLILLLDEHIRDMKSGESFL
jgi:hypothetical protein